MAIKICNCSVRSYAKDEHIHRTFDLYVATEGAHPEEAMAENLTLEDLKWLRDELAKSINLEKSLTNGNR